MFSDHDNPVTAAAAAPAHDSQSSEAKNAAAQENQAERPQASSPENSSSSQENAVHETPSQRTEEDPKSEPSAGPLPEAAEVHAISEARSEEHTSELQS